MALAERVHVVRRYQRAIRIDTDFGDPAALEGFVCPQSSAEVLENMARHALETGQGAFTWTGPYGGGKSSLAVVLGAMLNGKGDLRSEAQSIVGERVSSLLLKAFPPRSRGWRVLPVAGRRDRPTQVIGEAITAAGLLKNGSVPSAWSEKDVLDALEEIATRHPRAGGGLAVFIDELGKFLESAARDGTDIHLFQQLAEIASRSGGRLLVVGILHQAFEEYAHRLSRETRDEWAKIQGRFVDLPINADGNEQIDLLARAIKSDYRVEPVQALAEDIAGLVQGNTPPNLAAMLGDCWPLHPVTACLLGPLSRRRFGQNQRSLFGFLNSAEPGGFRDFLSTASENDLYTPDRLWDYLRINLEPSILVSPDGHRWALAADALGRCEALGGTELHLRLLKVIALADLLKERSRLPASRALLGLALPDGGTNAIGSALEDLQRWSLVAFRTFANAWTVFRRKRFRYRPSGGRGRQRCDGDGRTGARSARNVSAHGCEAPLSRNGRAEMVRCRRGTARVTGRDGSRLRAAPRRHRVLPACDSDRRRVCQQGCEALPRGRETWRRLGYGHRVIAKCLEHSRLGGRISCAGTCKRRPSGVAGRPGGAHRGSSPHRSGSRAAGERPRKGIRQCIVVSQRGESIQTDQVRAKWPRLYACR